MKTVIMAGGKGVRISSSYPGIPKPMIPLLQKPILEYQIECLKRQQCMDIVIVVGHLGGIIKNYFGDGGRFGVRIEYITEEVPLGTAGALFYLNGIISEDFLLINGDIIFDVDIERFFAFHKEKGGLVTIFTHPNDHPFDSGVIVTSAGHKVLKWLHKEDQRLWYRNCVNAGIHCVSPIVLKSFTKPQKRDLDREILEPLISEGAVFAYHSPEYIKDMGTPDRLRSVTEDMLSGKISGKNLRLKQKAVFLDRDGTINRYVGFLKDINAFELMDGVPEAIRMINRSGRLAIVATNQPVIARGEVNLDELAEIHNKMETLLGLSGAYLDDIFFCPHHPSGGFLGECPEYKIDCGCRKPKIGMLAEAAKKYNIDLSRSWMVGDGINDIEAGKNAGCGTALIRNENMPASEFAQNETHVPTYSSLLECVRDILSGKYNDWKQICEQ
jgi:D-glycero-D-manno-heptose 1,7-bisphosphate phosphatase